jgi:hypothetical protein
VFMQHFVEPHIYRAIEHPLPVKNGQVSSRVYRHAMVYASPEVSMAHPCRMSP